MTALHDEEVLEKLGQLVEAMKTLEPVGRRWTVHLRLPPARFARWGQPSSSCADPVLSKLHPNCIPALGAGTLGLAQGRHHREFAGHPVRSPRGG